MAARIDAGANRRSGLGFIQTAARQADIGDLGLTTLGRGLMQREARNEAQRDALGRQIDAEKAEHARNEARLWLAQESGGLREELTTLFNTEAERYTGAEDGFAQHFQTRMQETISARLGSTMTDERRTALRYAAEGLSEHFGLSATELETSRRSAYQAGAVRDGVVSRANAVLSDWQSYDTVRAEVPVLVEAAPEHLRRQLQADAEERLAVARFSSLIEDDPAQALAELDSGEWDARLGDRKGPVLNRARSAREAARREAARAQSEADMFALINAQPAMESHVASIAATGRGVEGFDEDDILGVLARRSPQRAAQFRREIDQAHATYAALGDIDQMTGAEINAHLQTLRPTPGAADFAQSAALYEQAARVVSATQEQRAEDPAAAVARSEPVRRASEIARAAEILSDPMTGEAERSEAARTLQASGITDPGQAQILLARTRLSEQERLGVPPTQRRVMTQAEADAAVARYEGETDPGRALRDVLDMANGWGAYAPQVLADLEAAGLPSEVRLAAALPQTPGMVTRYARALTSRDDNEDRLSASEKRNLENAVARELSPLVESFAANVDAAPRSAALVEAAYALALDARVSGTRRGAAARDAAQAFTQRYDYHDGYRVPVSVANAQVHLPMTRELDGASRPRGGSGPQRRGDVIAQGADAALSILTADNGARLLATEGGALPVLSRARITASGVLREGQWVTQDDESGLALMAERDGVLLPVRDAAGDPVRLGWDELTELGRVHIARPSQSSAVFDRMTALRRGEDPDAPGVRPYGRATGEGWRNWPILEQIWGDE
ncbi:hypothetical protein [Oceanicaulis sp. MMSF_3324]|uniref:hypothetical protein n=1 Tax=Oceanicaulis sp. MMSF_3324 TaxID=3046702 RepID=UPI00273E4627|nr:hypothetical protein [Oceanicaulis sp. MMSF_3324]